MFGFIKFIIGTAAVAGIGYFSFFVNIGDKTLYQHIRGISETREAQSLGDSIVKETEALSGKLGEDSPEAATDEKQTPRKKGAADSTSVEKKQHISEEEAPGSIADIISRNGDKVVIVNSDSLSDKDKQALGQLLKQKQ